MTNFRFYTFILIFAGTLAGSASAQVRFNVNSNPYSGGSGISISVGNNRCQPVYNQGYVVVPVANQGYYNQGYYNGGYTVVNPGYNQGYYNQGYVNTGYANNGNCNNNGYYQNRGYYNNGNRGFVNQGYRNPGYGRGNVQPYRGNNGRCR